MISKEVFMEIMAMHRNGKSIRAIAKETGRHRKTIKKHLLGDEFPRYRKGEPRESILAPHVQTIQDYLEEDDYKATWIMDRLKNRSYTGGYDTVKRYVRTIKERQTRLAYARFETEPGRQAQFDWGDFQVEEPSGRTTTVYVFMIVLGFSRAVYAEFVERATLESFMSGHIRGFRYLQGVPSEILYDNMKHVAVGRDEARKPIFNAEVPPLHPSLWLPAASLPSLQPLDEGESGTADRLSAGAVLAGLSVQLDREGQRGCSHLVQRDGQPANPRHPPPACRRALERRDPAPLAASSLGLRHLAQGFPQGLPGLPALV